MATEIAKLYAVIDASTQGFERGMGKVSGLIITANQGLELLSRIAGAAMGAIDRAIVQPIAEGIKEAAAFEKSLKGLEAAFGVSGKEAKILGQYIDDLSLDPSLRVNADDAAEALLLLGKAGISTDQAMEGVARSAVLLANATGEDIPLAAEVSIKAMSAWGLEASDMAYVADQVTGATESSTLSLQDMFLAYSMGGGAAAAAGVEFADFNAVMAAAIPLFSSGSDAGTSFKTFLDRLIPASKESAEMMRELGLYTGLTGAEYESTQNKIAKISERLKELDPLSKTYVDDVTRLNEEKRALQATLEAGNNAFFDEAGNMKSAAEIAGLLKGALGGLSEEKRKEALTTIFGSDAQRTAIALMNQGAEGIQHFHDIIGNTSAQERATQMTDNASDRFDNLRETVQVLSRKIGESFLPAADKIVVWLKDMVEKWSPKILQVFSKIGASVGGLVDDFIASTPQFDEWIGNLLDGAENIVETIRKQWPEIKNVISRTWTELQPILNATLESFKAFAKWFGSSDAESPIKWAVSQVAKVTAYMQVMADTMTAISELFNLSGRQINAYIRMDFAEANRLGDQIAQRLSTITNFDSNVAQEIAERMQKFGYAASSTSSGSSSSGGSTPTKNWTTEKEIGFDDGSTKWFIWEELKEFFGGDVLRAKALWDNAPNSRPRYYARGGIASGWSWVGEEGPELIKLPSGTQVYDAQTSQQMAGGNTITIQNLNINGGSNGIQNLSSTVSFLNALYG